MLRTATVIATPQRIATDLNVLFVELDRAGQTVTTISPPVLLPDLDVATGNPRLIVLVVYRTKD